MSKAIDTDLFILPGENLQQDHNDYTTMINLEKKDLRKRWESDKGQRIIKVWRANKFARETIEDEVGKLYDHLDLRGIPLRGEEICNVDLSNVEFFGADLSNSHFKNVQLENSHLSEAIINGTIFAYSNMNQVLIDHAEFDNQTDFIGVDLNSVNFTLAILLKDAVTNQQRIADLEYRSPILANVLRITSNYGRSFSLLFVWCLISVLFFGVLYHFLGGINPPRFLIDFPKWLASLYYSASVFFGAGSGITPTNAFDGIVTLIERAVSFLALGMLVTIMIRRTIG